MQIGRMIGYLTEKAGQSALIGNLHGSIPQEPRQHVFRRPVVELYELQSPMRELVGIPRATSNELIANCRSLKEAEELL